MQKSKAPAFKKLRKKRVKGTHYLYVRFKEAFQNPCVDKTYLSYDGNGSTNSVERGLNRLIWLYNTHKDRYSYAKIASKQTGEIVREYRCPKVGNGVSKCIKASVLLKPQARRRQMQATGKELLTLTGTWQDAAGKEGAEIALDQIIKQLQEGKWKGDYIEATLYQQPENRKIGKIDEEGNITIYEPTIYNEVKHKYTNVGIGPGKH